MADAQKIRVLLFLSFIALVYLLSLSALVRLALEKLGKIQPTMSRAHLRLRRAAHTLAVMGLGCFAYAYFVEPYWLAVTQVTIQSAKLPAGTRPIRIVHISDLHSDPAPRLEDRLPDRIAQEQPDVIVFTGDAINSPTGLPVFRDCVTRLAAIAPTFAVRGNWDTGFWGKLDLFGGTGVKELNGQPTKLEVEGVPLWIGGVPVAKTSLIATLFDNVPPNEFRLFLYHYPDEIEEAAHQGVDLYCAGHTHGGQIALPFYGALMTLSRFDKEYEAGLYRVGDTQLYVNRGIGMEGGIAPRMRFWARPELTVIEVVPVSAN